MNYYFIMRPLIGAIIGYVTNWIAVKMMFRPLKPIKIGKFTLPFTPGIIPKNKNRIAESIGDTISKELLSEEDFKKTLLSEKIQNDLKMSISKMLETSKENSNTIREVLEQYIKEENYEKIYLSIEDNLIDSIYKNILEANLGKLIAEQIEMSAKEKLKGNILGLLGGNAIVSSISANASIKIDEYIASNGKDLVGGMVDKELQKYTNKTVSEITESVQASNVDISEVVLKIYENLIIEKLPDIIKMLNISEMVQKKIKDMEMIEVEQLILNIMKKELNALVNLGALIGFILGMVNLLF